MKFSCIREYLTEAVGTVERVIEKNAALPILQNIIIKASKAKITVSATNLEIGINFSFQAKVDEEGSATIPAKTLLGFLNSLKEEKVNVSVKNFTLFLSAGMQKAEIKGMDPKDFPIIPTIKDEFTFFIPANQFIQNLNSVIFMTSVSGVRPELGGVYCSFEKKQVRLAATDSFRLGESVIKTEKDSERQVQCIIPTRTVAEIIRIFGGIEDDLEIHASANQIFFKAKDREFISRLIEGKFPDYTAIIPTSFSTSVYTKKDEFMQLLRAASVFAGKNNEIKVQLQAEKGKLMVESRNSDIGEHFGEMACTGKGKNLTVACNYQYFLEALGRINDETVAIEGNKETDALLLKSFTTSGTRYLIMPLRPY
jgi:DNA polymerase III subunit beta